MAGGGKLLVIDSLDSQGTTANSLLWPFGMSVDHAGVGGRLSLLSDPWPGVDLAGACRVTGGEPFLWVGDTPVASRTDYGKGTVIALGFGSLWNDENMGFTWMLEPNAETPSATTSSSQSSGPC